jgi:hypothetical protein
MALGYTGYLSAIACSQLTAGKIRRRDFMEEIKDGAIEGVEYPRPK